MKSWPDVIRLTDEGVPVKKVNIEVKNGIVGTL
jgi:hypothetical protein